MVTATGINGPHLDVHSRSVFLLTSYSVVEINALTGSILIELFACENHPVVMEPPEVVMWHIVFITTSSAKEMSCRLR